MGRCDKLLNQVRQNPRSVRFRDACKLAECYGFTPRQPGTSHRVYKRKGYIRILNFQLEAHGLTNEYQVKQLLAAIDDLTSMATDTSGT